MFGVPISDRMIAGPLGLPEGPMARFAVRDGKRVNKAAVARQLGIDRKSVYNVLEL